MMSMLMEIVEFLFCFCCRFAFFWPHTKSNYCLEISREDFIYFLFSVPSSMELPLL